MARDGKYPQVGILPRFLLCGTITQRFAVKHKQR